MCTGALGVSPRTLRLGANPSKSGQYSRLHLSPPGPDETNLHNVRTESEKASNRILHRKTPRVFPANVGIAKTNVPQIELVYHSRVGIYAVQNASVL